MRWRLDGSTRYSYEPDYTSTSSARARRARARREELVVGFGAVVGYDDVSNAGAQGPLVPEITGYDDARARLGDRVAAARARGARRASPTTSRTSTASSRTRTAPRSPTSASCPSAIPRLACATRSRAAARYFVKARDHDRDRRSYRFYPTTGASGRTRPRLRAVQEAGDTASSSACATATTRRRGPSSTPSATVAPTDGQSLPHRRHQAVGVHAHTFEGKVTAGGVASASRPVGGRAIRRLAQYVDTIVTSATRSSRRVRSRCPSSTDMRAPLFIGFVARHRTGELQRSVRSRRRADRRPRPVGR